MRDWINKVIDLLELTSEKCPFYKESTLNTFLKWLKEEIQESEEEIEKGDYNELEKELWDVFRDYISLLEKLKDEWIINPKNVFELIYDKIARRKSFLFKDWEITKEEAIKIWNEAKKKEWYSDDRLWNWTI